MLSSSVAQEPSPLDFNSNKTVCNCLPLLSSATYLPASLFLSLLQLKVNIKEKIKNHIKKDPDIFAIIPL
jgi:hypothetical protein